MESFEDVIFLVNDMVSRVDITADYIETIMILETNFCLLKIILIMLFTRIS